MAMKKWQLTQLVLILSAVAVVALVFDLTKLFIAVLLFVVVLALFTTAFG